MALAVTYTSENCPGMPKGVVVRVHTDKLAENQPAAWAKARKIHAGVWWEEKLEETREDRKENKLEETQERRKENESDAMIIMRLKAKLYDMEHPEEAQA